ncbi:hypothetical protein T9A_02856 [Alcanivorax jadensis T9]|jgi:hypothetical protein|uniref:Uncharacterized protein n=1 Tax=Alcanivorax jadensis T9 TaxID=1177181 RepID=A0ABR4W9P1_9GAMM|nr:MULTISPECIES: hypothetical protein [Alcanivorax]KGD60098.1 hypothetical protein T9A_02856 [Alcanivorax jadensis T9]|tara:strand:- start:2459 stop:2830 length:372 start_codon:yes stop_codon:yes gene_type:complete
MAFIPLAFVGLFIILAVWAVRSPKSRTDKEVGLTPQFEEICGGRIGMMNYTWPLVRHSIYDDFIVIKCLGGCYTIPRNSVKVERGDGVLSNGVLYKSPKYLGQELRIWTSSKNVVLEVLERNA